MKFIFATRNRHKVREIAAMLPAGSEMITMDEAGIGGEIEETGRTLRENSMLKAEWLRQRLRNIDAAVIADDSGLEVDSLNGLPGVNSARYAGRHGDDNANNAKLLEELNNKTDRKARFVCVITLVLHGKTHVFEGFVPGTIAHAPRGRNGFGYDPLFIPRGYRSTFAELGADVKNGISHRAIAFRKLSDFLATKLA
jgi:XTP/dITP diphosphohydrolase